MDKNPRFFKVSDDLRDLKVYPWIEEIISGRIYLSECKTCHSQGFTDKGDLMVSLIRGKGVKWPDWLTRVWG